MGAGAAIQAMRDLGLRHVVALTLSDKNYEETIPLGDGATRATDEIKRMSASEAKAAEAWIDDCEGFIETFHAPEKLTTACPGPSAVQRCTDALLTQSAELARRKNLPMHIHLAETKAQAVMGQQIYRTFVAQASGFARHAPGESFVARIRSGLKKMTLSFLPSAA